MARPGRATLLSELSRQFWPRRINQVQRWLRIAISALLLRRFGQSSAQADYREQNAGADPNDLLYSLEASQDYDPEPGLSQIRAKVYALNFSDDEFNPDVLQVLQTRMKLVSNGHYVVQQGSSQSYGHLTMAHPALWADRVREFMRLVEKDDASQSTH